MPLPLLLAACSDYGLEKDPGEPPAPGEEPPPPTPEIFVDPEWHDFGAVDPWVPVSQTITVENTGTGPLTVSELAYEATSAELVLTMPDEALPWELSPGDTREVLVIYTAIDDLVDDGTLSVASDDPGRPVALAEQRGTALLETFQTGWYIVEDDTPYPLNTDPDHVVDYNGDSDTYWYEPSGVHGMTGSADVYGDFRHLHDFIVERAGGPTVVTGPLTFHESSTLSRMEEGSFSYVMCDFWMPEGDDPRQYTVSSGIVDDGIRLIVNGNVIGELTYDQTGSWPLTDATPGAVNTLVVILEDNAEVWKYIHDLAFYKDGVLVEG